MISNIVRFPALFIGHGSPMNAIESNKFSDKWFKISEAMPVKPTAILCISAHWTTQNKIAITAMSKPKTIHDFGGFPQELFNCQYPAPGSPIIAKQIQDLLKPKYHNTVTLDENEWGLDHGCWSVLIKMFPKADIPVVQLSLNMNFTEQEHFELGRMLRPLREQNILILSSGNIVHNLQKIIFDEKKVAPWALDFHNMFKSNLLSLQFQSLIDFKSFANSKLSVPYPAEHYIPCLYTLGLMYDDENVSDITVFNDEVMFNSLSMFSFSIGSSTSYI